MRNLITLFSALFILVLLNGCGPANTQTESPEETDAPAELPKEILEFTAYDANPVFAGTDSDTWDQMIRERGFILKEGDLYRMWYTGYTRDGEPRLLKLGYATSDDGFNWQRHPDNPLYQLDWVEDMMVVKHEGLYYMFAEGLNDIAKMLTSEDGIHWENQGDIDIRQTNGESISEGPYGTPTARIEGDTWYLFYERGDLGIWLATSKDLKTWTNLQDDPVIEMGPETYDKYGLAVNQIVQYEGKYYAYYHGTAFEDWQEWSTNVAISDDLIHWEKYAGNPIMEENKSSGILVHDGEQFRLYTMHPEVCVHFPSVPESE